MTQILSLLILAGALQAEGDALKEQFARETDAGRRREILRKLAELKHPAAAELAAAVFRDAGRQAELVPEAVKIAAAAPVREMTTALIRAAGREKAAPILLPMFEALSLIGAPAGIASLKKHLAHEDPEVAIAAARAIGRIGGPEAREAILSQEEDPRLDVRKAVIRVLGSFRHEHTHPALFRAYLRPDTRAEAWWALAQEPDLRALDLYLEGLDHSDAELRASCVRALTLLGADAMARIEQKLERNVLPPGVVAELQWIFGTPRPVLRWLLLGPLDPAAAEPFDITVNNGGMDELVFDRPFAALGGGEVRWKEIDAAADGRVSVTAALPSARTGSVYAYAAVKSPAARTVRLQAGGEGTLAIWVGGKKVYDRAGNRPWAPDSDAVEAPFIQGWNYLLIKCARKEGDWAFSLHVTDAKEGKLFQLKPERRDPAEYLEFALGNPGDAPRGEALFRVSCARCHAVAGEGGNLGPDLSDVGVLRGRRELAEAVLFPARAVRTGYGHEVVLTRTGQLVVGRITEETLDELTVMDEAGQARRFLQVEVDRRSRGWGSLMPETLHAPFSKADIADLVAYLQSLKSELGFQSLFDGKSLDGWKAPDMSYFSVQDGAITGETTKDHNPPHNQFIVWQGGTVKNFDLRFRFRIFGAKANSGMQFRSSVQDKGLVHGYQADIALTGPYLGGIWDEYGPRRSLASRGERVEIDEQGRRAATRFADADALAAGIVLSDWNDYRIVARGPEIALEINGRKMSELVDREKGKAASEGVLAMPIIPGEPMKVQYKDIRLKPLP